MKKLSYFAGVILQILSLLLLLLGCLPWSNPEPGGVSIGFRFWLYAYLLFIPILACYVIDGTITVYRGCKYTYRTRTIIGVAKLLLAAAGAPLWIFFGGIGQTWAQVLWNGYFVLLLALQLLFQFLLRKDEV